MSKLESSEEKQKINIKDIPNLRIVKIDNLETESKKHLDDTVLVLQKHFVT